MKEKPISLYAHEVRAILKDRQTQLRRILRLPRWAHPEDKGDDLPEVCHIRSGCLVEIPCPYGAIGDKLWCRETWADVHPLQVASDRYSQPTQAGIPGPPGVFYRTIYRADGEYPPIWPSHTGHPYRTLETSDPIYLKTYPRGTEYGWNPSGSIPRWASRITLEIVGVRVERLQEITEADMQAEGLDIAPNGDPAAGFQVLWDSINGKRAPWASNPWVWVVSFKQVLP